jgi:hypothetical protein
MATRAVGSAPAEADGEADEPPHAATITISAAMAASAARLILFFTCTSVTLFAPDER